eukprot:sb/3478771/
MQRVREIERERKRERERERERERVRERERERMRGGEREVCVNGKIPQFHPKPSPNAITYLVESIRTLTSSDFSKTSHMLKYDNGCTYTVYFRSEKFLVR